MKIPTDKYSNIMSDSGDRARRKHLHGSEMVDGLSKENQTCKQSCSTFIMAQTMANIRRSGKNELTAIPCSLCAFCAYSMKLIIGFLHFTYVCKICDHDVQHEIVLQILSILGCSCIPNEHAESDTCTVTFTRSTSSLSKVKITETFRKCSGKIWKNE